MVAFSIFGFDAYRYGIFYAVAMFVVRSFVRLIVYKKTFAITAPRIHTIFKNHTEDLLIYGIMGVLIGGRLGEIFIYNFSYYRNNPIKVFAVHEGGMSFIGGIVGVSIALRLFQRRFRLSWKDFSLIGSTIASIIPFGSMIGRIGNFLNQELFGIPVTQAFPSLSESTKNFLTNIHVFYQYDIDPLLRINTNFLASFGEGLLLLLFMQRLFRKTKNKTYLRVIWLCGYSIIRFILEYRRHNSQSEIIFFLSKSQRIFLFFIIGCFSFRGRRLFQKHTKEGRKAKK